MGGVTYSNDAIGNRTSDGTWTYTWEHGRQLAGMSKTGTSINYGYGADGQRITKAVTEGGTTTIYDYFYSDGKLIHVSWNESDRVHIFYNANGSPISILYNGTRYYYVRNMQGDIVGITTASGLLRVAYTYDAWGKLLTTTGSMAGTLGQVNPLRYRGYVYDTETGLYYLGSRYYDPGVGRFINADGVSYLGRNGSFISFNLFQYCENNPVRGYDPSGTFDIGSFFDGCSWLTIGIAALVVSVSVLTCGVATPAMMAVATVTVTAGAATTVNGVSEIGEACTDYNFMRDGLFQGDEDAYNTYANTTAAVAEIGTLVCGGWITENKPRIKAYNNIERYQYTNTISDDVHMSRPYSNSILTQKEVIKYGKMTTDSFGYVFSADGTVNGARKLWRLGINVERELIWHWGHGF